MNEDVRFGRGNLTRLLDHARSQLYRLLAHKHGSGRREVGFAELDSLWQHGDIHHVNQVKTRELLATLKKQIELYKPDGWFMLECQVLDSSSMGERTILPYGPNNTYKTVPDHLVSPRGLASDVSIVIATMYVEKLEVKG